jgi:hypothetical protein
VLRSNRSDFVLRLCIGGQVNDPIPLLAIVSAESQARRLSPRRQPRIYETMATTMNFTLPDAVSLLTRTPATLDALLRGMPDIWARTNEGRNNVGNETWTAFDIVGHLIVGERTDWIPRARIILEHGEARAFDPFDRFAQVKESQGRSLEQLLDEFADLRKGNLMALHSLNLQPQDLARRGTHPELGVVTLSELLATWAVHDLTHVHQLSRVMAHQYRDAVGPWSAYLGVLKCGGRSA